MVPIIILPEKSLYTVKIIYNNIFKYCVDYFLYFEQKKERDWLRELSWQPIR